LFQHTVLMFLLILSAGFLSLTEIAFAGARKIKLKLLAEAGDTRAGLDRIGLAGDGRRGASAKRSRRGAACGTGRGVLESRCG
jgi:hypothetical protein